jgi:6-phosphofructokinase 1
MALYTLERGRTNMVVGFWNHQFFTHVSMSLSASQRKKIDPEGTLWNSLLASTGQPWKIDCVNADSRKKKFGRV